MSFRSMCITLGLLALLPCSAARAELIYGLTNFQQLVVFDSDARVVTSTTSLAGFSVTGQFLVSIDVRPATGELFGLSNQNNLFIINPTTGTSTQVGGTISPAPAGTAKAIDFNPTVDRIRLVSSGGSNLRLNPNDGAVIVDGPLAFAAGDPNTGDTPAVVNGAYTNSFAGATTTTLYNIESFNDVLVTQVPPNDGTLNTVGPIGFDTVASGGFTGFDISGATGAAYLTGNSLTGGLTANALYTVNLGTGAATLAGPISGINGTLRDIAVVPEPASLSLLVVGIGAALLRRR